jgi:hypothetical protein
VEQDAGISAITDTSVAQHHVLDEVVVGASASPRW